MHLADYSRFDGLGLAELIREGEVSAAEVNQAALEAIRRLNPQLNAIIEVYEEIPPTLTVAGTPESTPFAGVPFLLKDIGSHDADVHFELGSRLAKGLKAPPFPSELVRRFRSSGVRVLGRTNIPELGSSCTTEPLLYGPTRNPWNLDRTPGGSSGGAAAAVSAGIVPIAHANDAGGSIRWPASCCGLVGLKPSRNLNPLGPDAGLAVNGLAAEHILSRTVRDTAAMLDITAGPDAGAWCYTPRLAGSYLDYSKQRGPRLRVALNLKANFPPATVQPDVLASIQATAKLLTELGHSVEEASPEFDPEPILKAFAVIWSTGLRAAVEFVASLTRREVSASTLEPHVLAAYRDAEKIPAAHLQWALEQMNVVSRAYGRLFERFDVMLSPVGVSEAFELGRIGKIPTDRFEDWFMQMAAHCPFTSAINIAGIPAMSLPLGEGASGLPIGSHFVAGMGNEPMLLRLATELEAAQPWIQRRPKHHVSMF